MCVRVCVHLFCQLMFNEDRFEHVIPSCTRSGTFSLLCDVSDPNIDLSDINILSSPRYAASCSMNHDVKCSSC